MLKLKKGDSIKVLQGKDKGREGKIEIIFPRKGTILVPGINVYKKHVKKSVARDGKGGIYEVPKAISVSKIALVCPKCKKSTRVGFKSLNGKKERICKKCQKLIDKKVTTKKKK